MCFNFRVDKKNKEVVFAGTTGDLAVKIGVAKCLKDDVFDASIGKLIAIRRALNLPTDDLMDLVENEGNKQIFVSTAINNRNNFMKDYFANWTLSKC